MSSEYIKNINYRNILFFIKGNIKLFFIIYIFLGAITIGYLNLKTDAYLIKFNFDSSQISNLIKKTNSNSTLVNLDHYTDVELNLKNPSIYSENTLELCGYSADRAGRVAFVKHINPKVSPDIVNPIVEVSVVVNNLSNDDLCSRDIFEDFKKTQINNFNNQISKKGYDYFSANPLVSFDDLIKNGYFIEPKFIGMMSPDSQIKISKNYIRYLLITFLASFLLANAISYLFGKK